MFCANDTVFHHGTNAVAIATVLTIDKKAVAAELWEASIIVIILLLQHAWQGVTNNSMIASSTSDTSLDGCVFSENPHKLALNNSNFQEFITLEPLLMQIIKIKF